MKGKWLKGGLAVRTLGEVARELGLSKQRVAMIEAEALRKVRARLLAECSDEFEPVGPNPHDAYVRAKRRQAALRKSILRPGCPVP